MAKNPDLLKFLESRGDVVENLEAIQLSLSRCIDEGMIDLEDAYYNEILSLIDEATISKGWDELMEVVTKAKTLEIDVASWLASHGRTSISLPWPRRPA
ncbi:MAG TPA: hypothetical protein VLF94_02600 [Chlamydiales bacterium]|nr:hypothetical protein [Chlamydiales bacterium]